MDPITFMFALTFGIAAGNILAYLATALFSAYQYRQHYRKQRKTQSMNLDQLMEAFKEQYVEKDEKGDPRTSTHSPSE